ITGKQISRIRIVGGGAKNSILNQLTATETEKNIIVGPVEATSLGNIFNQMKALHYISSIQEGANKLNKCL
ncbi:MAG: FGGY-family carbohydrate kinase, partial [Sphaerochaetaceae bacterium]